MSDTDLRVRVSDSMSTLLARMLQRDGAITDDTQLMEELGLSSSLALELLLELEEELDIQINVEELDEGEMKTVGDLADFIATNSSPV
jgi:acyl carrier protein